VTRLGATIALAVLLPGVGAGCGSGSRSEAGAGPADTVRGVVALAIGELEGADEYVFGRVSGVAMDSLDRIYVADGQVGTIRAYDPEGRFLFRVARKGSGPAEVVGPCCLAWDGDGRLWVRDGGNGRYEAYRLGADGATYERELRMQHSDANFWAPLTFDMRGRLVDVGHVTGDAPGSSQLARFYIAPDGTAAGPERIAEPSPDSVAVRAVQRKTANGFATLYIYQPFGSYGLAAHGPGGSWATAASGYYVIRWTLPNGTARTVSRDWLGPELSDADVTWANENLAQTAKWVGTAAARLPFGVPERKAPLRQLWFDRLGRLWVQLTPASGDSESVADVYDTAGTFVQVARWPKAIDLSLGYVTDSVALGVSRDSLGVQRVALMQWRR
jgi:hypothetical protein